MSETVAFEKLARSIINDSISRFDHTIPGFTFKEGKTFNDALNTGKLAPGMAPRDGHFNVLLNLVVKRLKKVVTFNG